MNLVSFRLVIATLLSLAVTTTFSQAVSRATLHFATNEYRLTSQHERRLDSLASTLRNIPEAYVFKVAGHTDSVGSGAYNNQLSYNRALAVASYLKSKGFKQSRMKLEAKGFTLPVTDNSNPDNKERNRRVEIAFHLELPQLTSIAGVTIPVETIEVADKGGVVTTASGTRITIPPDAFTDAQGNPVKGKVNIEYTEYRDPIDFLLSDIPMHFNDGREAIPFNSAGMFTINASQGNEPVFLAGGKRLNVGFNYDGTVREASFYRWDANQNNWTAQQRLTQTLQDEFREYMLLPEGATICQTHDDLKQVFFVQSGLLYSDPGNSRVYHLYEAVKFYEREVEVTKKQEQFERKAKQMLRKYQLQVDKRFLGKEGFKLNQVRGKRDKSTMMLENITFRQNLTNKMIDSIEVMMFDDYALRHTDSGLTLVLYKGTSTVTVPGISIKQDEAKKSFDAGKWISDLEKHYREYKDIAARYRDTAADFQRQVDFFRNERNRIVPLSWSSWDSVTCFRSMHDGLVPDNNPGLSTGDWLLNYHRNKDRFVPVYTAIKATQSYTATEAKVQRYRNRMLVLRNPLAKLELSEADLQLPGNFSIASLGTYNCDQLQRLEDPVTLYVKYKNKQGKEIRPVVALLIDSKLNGIMRYDGSYGLSPYRIAFSPKSTSRMVLVDSQGDSYLVKPEEFANADLRLDNSTRTFIAEPIIKANNKDELRDRLSMK